MPIVRKETAVIKKGLIAEIGGESRKDTENQICAVSRTRWSTSSSGRSVDWG